MYNSTWYNSLIQPPLTPPDWLFAPAWIFLYVTILVSLLIFIFKDYIFKKSGYIYFAIQLFLNLIWSPIFFSLQNIGFALFVILLLDVFTILTFQKFYKVSKIAGLLLIPYILWILFATYLNIGYFVLNY